MLTTECDLQKQQKAERHVKSNGKDRKLSEATENGLERNEQKAASLPEFR